MKQTYHSKHLHCIILSLHFLSEFSNSSQWRSAGLDLAALSLCDYLVLSRGTFGLWSSILSGAVRITPKHRTVAGDPLLLNNQVPLIDFSHNWMSLQTRTELGSVCPQCLQRLPAGSKYQTKPTRAWTFSSVNVFDWNILIYKEELCVYHTKDDWIEVSQ